MIIKCFPLEQRENIISLPDHSKPIGLEINEYNPAIDYRVIYLYIMADKENWEHTECFGKKKIIIQKGDEVALDIKTDVFMGYVDLIMKITSS